MFHVKLEPWVVIGPVSDCRTAGKISLLLLDFSTSVQHRTGLLYTVILHKSHRSK